MLKVPNDKYQILNYYCENRIQDLYDIMVKFECEREAVKNYFTITLFGGYSDNWSINNDLMNKTHLKHIL